ncbi:calcium-binding protein 39-like isoform X2 [Schistocerca gregaria]|uniref:calcium-binding protein 39-like isoform X2 n=1 Tax=Schistocerca gregaria TaxID=7010 RepID=UPI00211DC881|nr:calcium-binding protein 39-like isoform X2 [Schistocerca gregaria]
MRPNSEQITQLSNEICSNDILSGLITYMTKLDFEAKKDLATVFSVLLRRQVDSRYPTVEYLEKNTSILEMLLNGYNVPDIALNCGTMLRECIRFKILAKLLLYSENFYNIFRVLDCHNFDIASDAFATFKDLLTIHKPVVAEFLEIYYERVFEEYTNLLHCENYVTKRQSLKLLGELLLDRSNFNVMKVYISHASNLKLMMTLLRDKSKLIQFEAFHVFKIFIANPNKARPIVDILQKNKERLIGFLSKFHNDRDDRQFIEEKAYLIKQIEAM